MASGDAAGPGVRRACHHDQPGRVHVVAATAFSFRLGDESTSNGAGIWQWIPVAGAQVASSPAVIMNDGTENIAAIGSDGNLYFYWQASDGRYVQELVDTSASL